ncbi:PLP-dependent aminotransferase family protein [Streptomyces sp. SID12488]|uniref:aminotransferase-like domain-containing protein n=1 Tax=Streptomyces sp. SID12488 TaxID=2706040 RepID=UPI0013DA120B|nr:PLP-dependent aminotransferase family protein [Streptomyces sp. SID12488]NEA62780.1 PLP-dependent aminotransferase family protein [Streptomyces sp. SID12488]
MDDYRRLADRIADDIATGRLRPGERLPPQRAFARRRGIAGSTAGRVYGELVRRGLVVGEVGRGTFVRAAHPAPGGRALAEPALGSTAARGGATVNLELNYPSAPGQSELLAPALAPLLRPDVLTEALRPAPAAGTPEARSAVAGLLATPGWRPDPDGVLFAGNARQAIAASLASLVRPGGRVGVEALTYPLVKEIAVRLGITLVPLAMDRDGLRPDALAAAHRTAPLSALYVQPTLHNPTSVTMGEERKRELARVIRELGVPVVEDRIWSFLMDATDATDTADAGEPLAARVPELAHVVDGLSKRVAPGLTVGFLVVPPDRAEAVAAAVRSGGWSAGRFALEAGMRWVEDGTVARLVAAKRLDAARRQRLLARELAEFGGAVRSDPYAYYAWWELPASWRADTFTAAAAVHGIAVTPGSAFAVGPQRAPDAVRLGLASAPEADLERALRTLAAIARRGRTGR